MSISRVGTATNRFLHSSARRALLACLAVLLQTSPLAASQREGDDPALLTLDRIFASGEFQPESYGPVRWLSRQGGYVISVPSTLPKGAHDLVRIDPATGKQEVLVSALHL